MNSERMDIPSIIRRRAGLILFTVMIAAVGALLVSLAQGTTYQAEAEVLLEEVPLDEAVVARRAFPTVDRTVETFTDLELFKTEAVVEKTAAEVGGDLTAEDVADAVEVTPSNASNVIGVKAIDSDRETAIAVANGVATNYIEFRRQLARERLDRAVELIDNELAGLSERERLGAIGKSLRTQRQSVIGFRALQSGNATVLRPADNSTLETVGSAPAMNAFFGGVLGLLLALGLALLLDRLDLRLKGFGEIESNFELPLLGKVPASTSLATGSPLPLDQLPPAEQEAFRLLRGRLRYFDVDGELSMVMVTSPSSADGKTTVATGLAAASAAAGDATLLLEADLRRPALAESIDGVSDGPGLAELLSGQTDLDGARRSIAIEGSGEMLDLIVAGAVPPNPAQLLEGETMKRMLVELRERYSLIVIDVPPLATVADAIPLVRLVDGVLVVGRVGKTTGEQARALREQLSGLDATVLGVVANHVSPAEQPAYGDSRRAA